MKKNLQLATLILAAGFFPPQSHRAPRALPPQGNEWIQEVSGTFSAGKTVKVKSSSGSIHIQGAQQSNVTYTIREHVHAASEERARRELSHMKFTTFSSGEAVVLQADCEGSNQGSIDFDIKVPAQTQLVRLQTEGGAVAAKNLIWARRGEDGRWRNSTGRHHRRHRGFQRRRKY